MLNKIVQPNKKYCLFVYLVLEMILAKFRVWWKNSKSKMKREFENKTDRNSKD